MRPSKTGGILGSVALGAVLASAPLFAGGCDGRGGLRSRIVAKHLEHSIPIENGPVVAGRFTAMDIENRVGGVRVLVNPRYEETTIQFRFRHADGYSRDELASFRERLFFAATHDRDAERSVLRVLSSGLPDATSQPIVDIVIRTPVCDGVKISNLGGPVELLDVRGAIDVETDAIDGEPGWILVRTKHPLTDPVRLQTTSGNVSLVASPESSGKIELVTDRGDAVFSARYGRTDNVRPGVGRWSGVWNDGANEISLRTGEGDARVMIVENPSMYTLGWR